MWDDGRQQRLDELRRRAAAGTLRAEERQELDGLVAALEQAEWAALAPALDRLGAEQGQLRGEQARLRAQNAELAAVTEKYAGLLARARAQLDGLRRDREALRAEYERVLG